MYKQNSPAYEYALSHASVEPDIFFDEKEDGQQKYDSIDNLRLIYCKFIEAANGDMCALQAYMSLFAGLSLRQAAGTCGRSHEWVRLKIEMIRDSHPDIYGILSSNSKNITSMIPLVKYRKWRIEELSTGKVKYVHNLSNWCKKRGYNYQNVFSAIRRNCPYRKKILITRNF